MRIYARALSDAEIASLAQPPVAPRFLPPILVGNQLILNWTGQGQLQSASVATGPYTSITPAPNPPYTNRVVPGQNRFFRLLPVQ